MNSWKPMLATLLMVALCAGCGDQAYTPAGPSGVVPPLRMNLSGQYFGSLVYRDDRGPGRVAIVVRLRQDALAFTGTWHTVADDAITGTVSGTLASPDAPTTLTARWTIDARSTSSVRCIGTTDAQGSALPLIFTAPTWALGACATIHDVRWHLEWAHGAI